MDHATKALLITTTESDAASFSSIDNELIGLMTHICDVLAFSKEPGLSHTYNAIGEHS